MPRMRQEQRKQRYVVTTKLLEAISAMKTEGRICHYGGGLDEERDCYVNILKVDISQITFVPNRNVHDRWPLHVSFTQSRGWEVGYETAETLSCIVLDLWRRAVLSFSDGRWVKCKSVSLLQGLWDSTLGVSDLVI